MARTGDMTQGTEWKQLLLFSLPLMVGNILQQLYNTVDGIIVGNFVSEDALAAVGTCAPLTMLFVALAIGMSNGSAIVVAQLFGAKRYEDMRRAVSTSMIILIGMGLLLSVVGVSASRPLLVYGLNVNRLYLDYAVSYFSIYACGLVFQFTYNICSAILRSLGDSKATLYFLLVSSVTNILLDMLFVIAFRWGVTGAAIATVISQALSAVVALVYMLRRHEVLRFHAGEFRFHPASALQSMRMAVPTTLLQCVVSCGNIVVQRLINSFDVTYPSLATGVVAGMRLESFILIPLLGLNISVATFTGQNIGAGKPERVKRGRNAALVMAVLVTLVIGSVTFLLRDKLLLLFGLGPQALGYGSLYLAVLCPSLLLFALHISTAGVMQGAGDVMFNTFVTLSSFLFRITLAYLLAYYTPLAFRSVWFTLPIAWLYNVAMSWGRFYSGKWKTKALVKQQNGGKPA